MAGLEGKIDEYNINKLYYTRLFNFSHTCAYGETTLYSFYERHEKPDGYNFHCGIDFRKLLNQKTHISFYTTHIFNIIY